jgi:PAS domain S-box-containing protein
VRIDDEDGQPRALGTIMRDITAQKQTLRQKEQRYSALYNAMTEGVAVNEVLYNDEGEAVDYTILEVNPTYEAITGLAREQAIGMKASDLYDDFEEPPYLDTFVRVAETGEAIQFEIYTPSEEKHFRILVVAPEKGQFATIFDDITEQKQAEAALRESQTLLQGIMDNLPVDVLVKDLEGRHVLVNQHALDTSGFTLEQVLGKTDADLFPPEFAKEMQVEEARLIDTREPIAREIVVPMPQGELYQYLVRFPIYDDNGNLYATGSVTTDISLLKQAEQERDRLQQEVIEAQREALKELSAPAIPVMDRILVMPLVGSIDTMRARDLMRVLLQGISEHRAQIVILDVTGVPIMDTGIVNHINKTIQAARLKGAHAIVTGISDAVAEAVVDLGIDWSDVQTLRDLQTGLRVALEQLGRKLV